MANAHLTPVIETERVLLRGWREEDLDPYAEMLASTEVTRFLGGDPRSRDETWREIAMLIGHWELRGYGLWVVERKADGALLGRVGLWRPEGWPGLEVGWALAPHAQGAGYATEAAHASVQWAWKELGARELISVIDPANERSRRVAERLGMSLRREQTVNGRPAQIYGLDRPVK